MKILIILGHPSLKRSSFCEALAQAYRKEQLRWPQGAAIQDCGQRFDPILHEGYEEEQPLELISSKRRTKSAGLIIWSLSIRYGIYDSAILKASERSMTRDLPGWNAKR